MKIKKIAVICMILCLCAVLTTGCSDKNESKDKEPDFSQIQNVCELSSIECWFHNVCEYEEKKSFGRSKKFFIEYRGVVKYGVDANKIEIASPNAAGEVEVTLPEVSVSSVDLDTDSIEAMVSEEGIFAKITTENQAEAIAVAQDDMEKKTTEDTTLKAEATKRAKVVIENFVLEMGNAIGEEYTVVWK